MKRIRQYAATFVSSLLALAIALATVPTGAPAIEAFAEETEGIEEITETEEESTEEESTGNTVCTIDGTGYTSLQGAIDAADSGDVIQLTGDVELDSTLDISKVITLRLMGYTISASESFNSGSSASLIYVHDTSSSVGIIGGKISGSCTNLIKIIHATLSLTGVTLNGNDFATYGVYVYGTGATLSLVSNCTIKGVKTGIKAEKCNPSGDTTSGIGTIQSTTINASSYGVHLYMSLCTTIKNCSITGGTYGVYVNSNCGDSGYRTEVTLHDSTITGTDNYAVYVRDQSWLGSGTLKAALYGCTLFGGSEGNLAAWSHDYMSSVIGKDNFSFTYDEDTNIVCCLNQTSGYAHYTTHAYVLTEAVEPTCEESGMAAYYTCSRCGKLFTAETGENGTETYTEIENTEGLVVEATGHDWGEPEWTWTAADDGYTVTVTWTCRNDKTHTYTASSENDEDTAANTVTVTSETDAVTGVTVYTATATGPDGETVTDIRKIDANGEEFTDPEEPGEDEEEPGDGTGSGDAEDEEHSGKPDGEDSIDPENPDEDGSHGGSGDDQEGEDLPGEGDEPEGGSTPEFNSDRDGRWIEIGGFVYYYEEDDEEEDSSGGTIGSGALALVNVDAETGAYLGGATYALFRSSNNNLVGVYTADERGWISTYALSYDTYYFVQVEAAEGYVLDQTPIYVTLTKTLSYSPEYPWVIKAESAAADAAAVVEAADAEMTEAEETAE